MQSKAENSPINHLHYHYHYYYYNNLLTPPVTDFKQTLSHSVIYDGSRQNNLDFSPQAENQKMPTEGCETIFSQKTSMSQIINNQSHYQDQYRLQLSNLKLRSAVEEQFQPNRQQFRPNKYQGASGKKKLFREQDKQKTTLLGRGSPQNRLVAYYQEELKKYISQIERLKMVQEQCTYLRERFYNHYEERCYKNDGI